MKSRFPLSVFSLFFISSLYVMGMENLSSNLSTNKISEKQDLFCCLCKKPIVKTAAHGTFHPDEKNIEKQHLFHLACAYLHVRKQSSPEGKKEVFHWELEQNEWKANNKTTLDFNSRAIFPCPICKGEEKGMPLGEAYLELKKHEKELPFFDRVLTFNVSLARMVHDVKKLFWVFVTLEQKECKSVSEKFFGDEGLFSKRLDIISDYFNLNPAKKSEEFSATLQMVVSHHNLVSDRFLSVIRKALLEKNVDVLRRHLDLAGMWITDIVEMKIFLKKFWNTFSSSQQKFFLERALALCDNVEKEKLLNKYKIADEKSEK